MNYFVIALSVIALAVSSYRWIRVGQREHYLPGSISTTALRWLKARPEANIPIVVVAIIALAIGIFTSNEKLQIIMAALSIISTLLFPYIMSITGKTGKLKFTRRATLFSLVSGLILILDLVILSLILNPIKASIIVLTFHILAFDLALGLLKPVEKRSAQKFVDQATKKLKSINPEVIAITGSYGKTSTKEHLADLIRGTKKVSASPASWNNTAGLSRAINEKMGQDTEVFIAEMGTYGPGEIRDLCSWVEPSISAITAIGPVHLERMGSIENIVKAKSEITEEVDTVILNTDIAELAELANKLAASKKVITCGTDKADVVVQQDKVTINKQSFSISIPPGVHLTNLACAIACGIALGVGIEPMIKNIQNLSNAEHRAAITTNTKGVIVIDDTFNANPAGVRRSVDRLLQAVPKGHKVVATPGMVELGKDQFVENEKFGQYVKENGAELVVIGYTNKKALLKGAKDSRWFPDRNSAVEWSRKALSKGDGILWENDLPDHYA